MNFQFSILATLWSCEAKSEGRISGTSLQESTLPSSITGSKACRILLVDDDADHRIILGTSLEARGYYCCEATDGEDGFAQLFKQAFDLVICDYQMPHMNGIQFIEKVRMTYSVSSIPIIFMTGHSDSKIFQDALAAGANATLAKPYSFYDLQATIHVTCGL